MDLNVFLEDVFYLLTITDSVTGILLFLILLSSLKKELFITMTKLFTWEITAQRQILQARHLRKNVSKIQFPSLQEISKQEIQRFMMFTVPWIRILACAPSLFTVTTSLSSLIMLKIFHVQYSTASWLNLSLTSILRSYKTIQLCN